MKTLFRILGTAAAVAVTGAAIVALDKILNQKDPLHVEEVEFPEDAELDPKEAEKAAEAYAEGEAKAADKANAEAAAAEEAAAPAAPAEGGEKPVCDPEAPNPNPVEAEILPVSSSPFVIILKRLDLPTPESPVNAVVLSFK